MGLDVQNRSDPLLSNNSLLIPVGDGDGDRSSSCDGLVTLARFNTKRSKRTCSHSFSFEAQHRINFLKTKVAADQNLSFYPTKSTKYRLKEYPITNMSQRRRNGNIINRINLRPPHLELRLSLSPPNSTGAAAEAGGGVGGSGGARPPPPIMPRPDSPSRSVSVSPPSSCLSLEPINNNQQQDDDPQVPTVTFSSSPDATAMILVGCPRCYMYIMLPEDDRKCPKCKRTVLIDVLQVANTTAAAVAAAERATRR